MIYLDMDGVLADFDAGCRLAGGEPNWEEMDLPRSQMSPAQIARDDKIREVMSTPGFFRDLPPMADAAELWEFCEPYDPIILTARPRDEANALRCAMEKRAWVHRVFGPVPDERFICTLSKLKYTFIGHRPGPAQILVDDRVSNCNDWGRNGGHAVLHRSAAGSIAAIQDVLESRFVISRRPAAEARV